MRQWKYGLQIKGTKREVTHSRSWQQAFLSGQRVEMSFIFDDTGPDIHCTNCQIWFRRIHEIQTHDGHQDLGGHQNDPQHSGSITESSNVKVTGLKRTLYDLGEYEEDIASFKLVRVVRRQRELLGRGKASNFEKVLHAMPPPYVPLTRTAVTTTDAWSEGYVNEHWPFHALRHAPVDLGSNLLPRPKAVPASVIRAFKEYNKMDPLLLNVAMG
ncbi:hypothetical protein G6011_09445 [Alternaria panax]|uniref:Uncharacterized protein n=1 Tax=Alternaria panax TaxID=48097 RepID=A0AAD4IBC1_9PLEO|nr:hypothetical protein G6011_09445 [Alternaria panax]